MARASCSNRPTYRVFNCFTATVRLSRVSRAFQTCPIPPSPSGPTISYGPSRVPVDHVMRQIVALSGRIFGPSTTITTPAMMTGVGMILGTAAYMSPEQAKGRPADKRSDIWAFGCVLYEMLTGRRAFEAGDVTETLACRRRRPTLGRDVH